MKKSLTSWIILLAFSITGIFAQDVLEQMKKEIGGMYSSFTGNFTISSSSGSILSGKIYYQYPGKLHIKSSDGGVIATNGRFLWIYNPSSMRCMKQDVGGTGGGILGMLSSYQGQRAGSAFVFRNPSKKVSEITVTASGGMLRSVRFKNEDSYYTVTFSGIKVGAGIRASLFNYKPPTSAQVIENPLNK